MQIIRKVPCIDFKKNLKTSFGCHFGTKNFKQSFSLKMLLFNFKPFCCYNFMQKSEKFHVLSLDNIWKTSFQFFLAQKPQNKSFPKNSFWSILGVYASVTWCKKSEKLWLLIFHKTWKISFCAHFGSFWPKNLKTRLLRKNHIGQH